METIIKTIMLFAAILFISIDSLLNFGSIEGISFGKNSFGKKKEPMYKDDRTINRHYGE